MFERAHEVLGELTSPRSSAVPKPTDRPSPSSSSSDSSGSGGGGDPSGPTMSAAPANPIPDGPVPDKPRVGGNMFPDADYTGPDRFRRGHDTAFFTGGKHDANGNIISLNQPRDALGHRPQDFRSKQRQAETLKEGLPDALKLELPKDGKLQTPVMTWVNELTHHLELRGMEPAFYISKIQNGTRVYGYLLKSFGDYTTKDIADHGAHFLRRGGPGPDHFDEFDKENLRLSAITIRNSLGPNLLQRVSSLLASNSTGPMVFKTALDQVMHMNSTTIRTLSNQLGELQLKSIPGESAPDLTEKVTELAREIEGSGKAPDDLINLVSKPFTKGTVDSFKTHALGIHTQVMKGQCTESWSNLVQNHNAFYQDLVQSGDYPPASGKKDEDNSIQALVAKTVDQRLQQRNNNGNNGGNNNRNTNNGGGRTCYNCGETGHIAKNCPKKKDDDKKNDGGGKSDDKKEKDWRHIPPNSSKGEGKEKTVDGKVHKWCGKCRQNKGLWTVGRYLHSTEEHRSKKKDDNTNNNGNETGNLGYLDEPLDFGFLSFVSTCPKGCCGDQ